MAGGLVTLIDALYARTHGGMVDGGPYNHFLELPWWLVAPMGVAVLGGSLYGLWQPATRRD